MKTNLPATITSVEEAKAFLTELQANGEAYHPEDNAHDIEWRNMPEDQKPDYIQFRLLNKLMNDIYVLNGNDHTCPVFDPCEFLLELDPDYAGAISNVEELGVYQQSDIWIEQVDAAHKAFHERTENGILAIEFLIHDLERIQTGEIVFD